MLNVGYNITLKKSISNELIMGFTLRIKYKKPKQKHKKSPEPQHAFCHKLRWKQCQASHSCLPLHTSQAEE